MIARDNLAMNKKQVEKTKPPRIDQRFYDPLLIEKIFATKESITSYLNTDSILQRRDIAGEILALFNEFQSLKLEDHIKSQIIIAWIRNAELLQKSYGSMDNLYDYLKKLDPIAVELLGLPQEINLDVLKAQYRKASKKYHPDVGGSHENMLALNEAVLLFQDAIQNYHPQISVPYGQSIPNFYPLSWQEFLLAINLISSCIYGDFFAADKSFLSLQEAMQCAKDASPTQIAILTLKLSGVGGVLYKPCDALSKFKMKKELKIASEITSFFTDQIYKYWNVDFGAASEPDTENFLSIEDLTEISDSHLVIQHIEQANNAFRLGAIDDKRYKSVITRLEKRKGEKEEYLNTVDVFIAHHSFLQKLSNSDYGSATPTSAIIPPPSEDQKRFDHLSDFQKWEYLNAFGPKPSAEGFDKYFKIRIHELLLGMIDNYASLELSTLKQELEYFADAHNRYVPAYELLLEFFVHLQELESEEREKSLNMLRKVDDPTFHESSSYLMMSISLDDYLDKKENPDYRNPIEVTDKYIEFAKLPCEQIKAFHSTGEYLTDFEIALNRDRSALRSFEKSSIGIQREHIWIHAKNPTRQDVIQSLEPYVKGLLELGTTFHPKNTGELQIGYSINQLTTAYAAEKEWEKVLYWGELFFDLPRHYRDQSTLSEQRPLIKRIERAKKGLAK